MTTIRGHDPRHGAIAVPECPRTLPVTARSNDSEGRWGGREGGPRGGHRRAFSRCS